MISRITRRFALLAMPALAMAFLAAPSAKASLYTQFKVDSGAYNTLVNGAALNGSLNNFSTSIGNVAIEGQSKGTNASPISNLLTSTVSLTNSDSVAHTVTIEVSGAGYTLPSGQVLIIGSSLGGTVFANNPPSTTASTAQYETWVNNSSSPYDMSGSSTGLVPNPAYTLPTVTGIITQGYNLPSGTASLVRTSDTSAYTVTQTITFVLQAGASINYSASTNIGAVPEPGTVAMAFTALPLLGLGYWRNRRRTRA